MRYSVKPQSKRFDKFTNMTFSCVIFIDVPGAPGIPEVSDILADSMTVSWTPPTNDGGSPITGYTVEKRESGKYIISHL